MEEPDGVSRQPAAAGALPWLPVPPARCVQRKAGVTALAGGSDASPVSGPVLLFLICSVISRG